MACTSPPRPGWELAQPEVEKREEEGEARESEPDEAD